MTRCRCFLRRYESPFRAGTEPYEDALRRVYEPIVTELDKLYAQSKMVFLAWTGDRELQKERDRLKSEIEGRDVRIYPEAVGPHHKTGGARAASSPWSVVLAENPR